MQLRTLVSLLNLAAIAGSLLIWFEFPQYADYALYGLLVWMFVGFSIMYTRLGRRTVGGGPPGATPTGPTAPLPSGGPSRAPTTSSSAYGFCVFCAAPIAPGTTRCPACGHPIPVM